MRSARSLFDEDREPAVPRFDSLREPPAVYEFAHRIRELGPGAPEFKARDTAGMRAGLAWCSVLGLAAVVIGAVLGLAS